MAFNILKNKLMNSLCNSTYVPAESYQWTREHQNQNKSASKSQCKSRSSSQRKYINITQSNTAEQSHLLNIKSESVHLMSHPTKMQRLSLCNKEIMKTQPNERDTGNPWKSSIIQTKTERYYQKQNDLQVKNRNQTIQTKAPLFVNNQKQQQQSSHPTGKEVIVIREVIQPLIIHHHHHHSSLPLSMVSQSMHKIPIHSEIKVNQQNGHQTQQIQLKGEGQRVQISQVREISQFSHNQQQIIQNQHQNQLKKSSNLVNARLNPSSLQSTERLQYQTLIQCMSNDTQCKKNKQNHVKSNNSKRCSPMKENIQNLAVKQKLTASADNHKGSVERPTMNEIIQKAVNQQNVESISQHRSTSQPKVSQFFLSNTSQPLLQRHQLSPIKQVVIPNYIRSGKQSFCAKQSQIQQNQKWHLRQSDQSRKRQKQLLEKKIQNRLRSLEDRTKSMMVLINSSTSFDKSKILTPAEFQLKSRIQRSSLSSSARSLQFSKVSQAESPSVSRILEENLQINITIESGRHNRHQNKFSNKEGIDLQTFRNTQIGLK